MKKEYGKETLLALTSINGADSLTWEELDDYVSQQSLLGWRDTFREERKHMHLEDGNLEKEWLTGWSETDADTSLFIVMSPGEAW